MAGCDHRAAHGLRFDNHPTERLGIGRGGHHHVGQHEGSRHVAAIARKLNRRFEPSADDLFLQLLAIAATALIATDQNTAKPGPVGQARQRLDQDKLALPAGQPPGQHDHPRIVRHAPLLGKLDDPLGADGGGIESGDIDTARNHANPFGIGAVTLADLIADKLRNCDHPVAARHDRIIQPLERAGGAVIAMKGGHEGDAGLSRRRQRAPRRRPRAGVENIDFVFLDQRGQPVDVPPHLKRVL